MCLIFLVRVPMFDAGSRAYAAYISGILINVVGFAGASTHALPPSSSVC